MHIAGHIHAYERMQPMYANVWYPPKNAKTNYIKDPKATLHIVEGIAGTIHLTKDQVSPLKEYSVLADDQTGYGVLKIINTSHIKYEHWRSRNLNINDDKGEIIDYLLIEKTKMRTHLKDIP